MTTGLRLLSVIGLSMLLGLDGTVADQGQERAMGGVGLTVYADANLRGRSATIRGDTPNLGSIGMDRIVSSLQAGPGEMWEVCEQPNYRGRCVVVSGSETDLRRSGWDNRIASARRVRSGGGITPPGPPGTAGVELFSNTRFRGNRRAFNAAVPDLRSAGFNDAARSLRIMDRSRPWEICVDAQFINCRIVTGDVPDLNQLGLSRRISSIRPARIGGGGRAAVVLYDDRGYRGQSYRVERNMPAFIGFGGRAESARVEGGAWELCERPRFGGRCVVISGDIPDLGSLGLRNRVGSARPAAVTR